MSYDKLGTLPVYIKALELCKISREIASFVTFNKDLLKLYQSNSLRDIIADSILTDSNLIHQKIALAETKGCHSEKVKSAAFINVMTRNIISYCNGLEMDGVKEKEYLNLLRQEVISFRKSFRAWRKSFRDNNNS